MPLPVPSGAAQDDGDFALFGGVLHEVGHPVHQIVEVFGIAVADDCRGCVPSAVATSRRLRLDAEALP